MTGRRDISIMSIEKVTAYQVSDKGYTLTKERC